MKPSRAQGEIIPAVSFEISRRSSGDLTPPPSTPACHVASLSSPQCGRRAQALGLKTGADKSGTQSPASLPDSPPKHRTKSTEGKKSASLTNHSRNSSAHSLMTDFDNSVSVTAPEKGGQKNLPRSIKIKHLKLMAKKRQEILQLQKLVTYQQNSYIKLYAQIKDLEARSGIDSGDCLGKMRILTMNGWPPHDLLMLVQDPLSHKKAASGVLGPAAVEGLRFELFSIPKEVSDLGNDILTRRLKVLEYFRKRTSDVKVRNEFDTETEVIHKLINETSKRLEDKVKRIMNITKASWKDRDNLIKKVNQLNKELSSLQNNGTETMEKNDIGDKVSSVKFDTSSTDLKEKLNKERAARESLKHMVATAEGLLRSARARITVLERELKSTQKQMQATALKHKEFELLHRCRQTSYGVRSKKLLEDSKTGEVTIEMLTLQRNALELRVTELQDQIKSITEDYVARESKLQENLDQLQEKLVEQEKHRIRSETRVMDLEKRIKDIHEQYRQLLEQSDKLMKMSSEKCLDYLPRKENEPSLTEAELWKDLEATKKRLEQVTTELRQSREDKESLLNSLAKIAQEGSENNMANELLLREQTNFRLQKVIEELKQNLKSMNEKLAQKDRQIISLNMEASRTDYECCSNTRDNHELAFEVMELSTQVAKLTRERESLVTAAMSRALMLERHERCADLFARVTRARRDMAAQLEGQERERPHSETDAKLPSSMSPVCLKAAETWSELRSDRERVLQLQELVASQNLQLKRERRVRNHLEQRRAILERLFVNRSTSKQYIAAENVATYLGTSSYLAKDAFVDES
ncbi:uncharacterized protein LOC133517029 isoform X2 [Cydia pomonella]|uniref:uncharacterized protein LOC133517029 isoform X2 n=1 Tax=Cydia pomonella TaxID=82600 RepID=UPI002ADE28BC|nr:uncharacterized protein LOC133517029 isoform X2 [Cydia pomonella]